MERIMGLIFGTIMTLFCVVAGLWLWSRAVWITDLFQVNGPGAMKLAIRCLAVGLLAGAQLAVMAGVVSGFYRLLWVDRLVMWISGSVFSLSMLLAVAFGIAGR